MGRRILLTALAIFAMEGVADAEEFAQPPKSFGNVEDVFFDNAFDELVGEPPAESESQPATTTAVKPQDSIDWKSLIDEDSLQTEVKRITNQLAQVTKNPARFKSSGYEDARRELTLLAVLFQVIGDYSDDIRWQSSAVALEQESARVAGLCALGSDESLQAAEQFHAALEEVIRGQPIPKAQNTKAESFLDFAPLMQRMEISTQERLPKLLAKQRDFQKQALDVDHEAQLLALLSQVIRREEYGFADDETYQSHADLLRLAAKQLHTAASEEDFAKAVEAAAAVNKSCAACHADYRG